MKIRVMNNDQDQLLVKMTPTAAWALLGFGLLMIASCPLIVWALSTVATVELTDGELRYRSAMFDRYTSDEFVVERSKITEFAVESRSEGKALTVVANLTEAEQAELRVNMLDGDGKRGLADQLNTCLEADESFSWSSGTGTIVLGLAIGLTMLVAGLVCLFFLQTAYVYGHREAGQLSVYIRRWLFPWRREGFDQIDLADFRGVVHESCTVGGATSPQASSNYVYACTEKGERLGLASGPMFTEASTEEISTILESWVLQPQLDATNA